MYRFKVLYNYKRGIIMGKIIKTILSTIKKILTSRVVPDDVLSFDKYNKSTIIPKDDICVLGISRL